MTGNTLEVETGVPVTVTVGLEELYPGPRTCRDTRCEEQGQRVSGNQYPRLEERVSRKERAWGRRGAAQVVAGCTK